MEKAAQEKTLFKTLSSSKSIALIGVFASLHATLYFIPSPLWRNWAIYLEPIEGIVLGSLTGPLAAFIGSFIARLIKPDEFWMFGVIAEPIGVLFAGLLAEGRWKHSIVVYGVMLAAYFTHPFGRMLPLWTILDVLLAFILMYPVSKVSVRSFSGKDGSLLIPLAAISFITASADSLARIFLLIPAGLYAIFNLSFEVLYSIFVAGAIYSYVEDAIMMITSSLIGPKILDALKVFYKK
jgi:hypothetical protein